MAFTSGVATSISNLMDAFQSFLGSNGWTVNNFSNQGAGKKLHVSKGDVFANLRGYVAEASTIDGSDLVSVSNQNGLWVNLSSAYSGAVAWYKQDDAPYIYVNPPTNSLKNYQITGIVDIATTVNYWFFSYTKSAFIVIENPAGRFSYLSFGELEKTNDYDGGQYCFGKHSSSSAASTINASFVGSVYIGSGTSFGMFYVENVDGSSGWARTIAQPGSAGSEGNIIPMRIGDTMQKMKTIWATAPSSYSSQPVLFPIGLFMTRDGIANVETTPWSLMGMFEKLSFLNIYSLIPGSTYTIGADEYKIFPMHEKVNALPFGAPSTSGSLGFALRSN